MKLTFIILILRMYNILPAQIPSGYYDTALNLTGTALKNVLNDIISSHTEYSYTSSCTDTWDILKESDKDPNNPDNVILFYTNRSVNAAQEYNNGSGWSREHVWAKSRDDFGTRRGAGTDCHHLRPADISVNSTRSNRAFFNGGSEVWDEGIFTGCYLGTSFTFEPRDDIKGDVARMIFYMATRYEGENGEVDLELTEEVLGNTDKQPLHGVLSTLLEWHKNDPVDDFENNRNEVVYSYQNNRNPFIDHPEYVELIWGGTSPVHTIKESEICIYTIGNQIKILSPIVPINKVEVFSITGKKELLFTFGGLKETVVELNSYQGLCIVRINDSVTGKAVL